MSWLESLPTDREVYLYEVEADASLIIRKGETSQIVSLDRDGVRLRNATDKPLATLAKLIRSNR